jgi:hypothetical protein
VTYHDGIHNAVVTLIRSLDFPLVTYPAGIRTTSDTVKEKAKSIRCHRTEASFGKTKIGQAALGVTGCVALPGTFVQTESWLLELGFDRQIDLTALEAAWGSTPLRVSMNPSDPTNALFVQIDLGKLDQRDPVEQQESKGTKAIYTLTVHWPGE